MLQDVTRVLSLGGVTSVTGGLRRHCRAAVSWATRPPVPVVTGRAPAALPPAFSPLTLPEGMFGAHPPASPRSSAVLGATRARVCFCSLPPPLCPAACSGDRCAVVSNFILALTSHKLSAPSLAGPLSLLGNVAYVCARLVTKARIPAEGFPLQMPLIQSKTRPQQPSPSWKRCVTIKHGTFVRRVR